MLREIIGTKGNADQILNPDKLKEAPETGHILAFFQNGIEFDTYRKNAESTDIEASCLDKWKYKNGSRILELHLFDQKTEYRAIYTENLPNSRYRVCIIKGTEKEEAETKEEYQMLHENFWNSEEPLFLRVVNYIEFVENMLVINNYRLAGIYTYKEVKNIRNREKERK